MNINQQKPGTSRTVVVLATLLVMAFCGVVALFAAFLAQGVPGRVAALPTATATPSQHMLAEAYVELVSRDAKQLSNALGVVSDQCGVDVTACDAAVVAASATDDTFLHDIQRIKAPICLQAADTELQNALSALYAGLIDSHTGLQAQDGALVTQGAHEITAATTAIKKATTLIAQVICP
jgi:hypothetical protein